MRSISRVVRRRPDARRVERQGPLPASSNTAGLPPVVRHCLTYSRGERGDDRLLLGPLLRPLGWRLCPAPISWRPPTACSSPNCAPHAATLLPRAGANALAFAKNDLTRRGQGGRCSFTLRWCGGGAGILHCQLKTNKTHPTRCHNGVVIANRPRDTCFLDRQWTLALSSRGRPLRRRAQWAAPGTRAPRAQSLWDAVAAIRAS